MLVLIKRIPYRELAVRKNKRPFGIFNGLDDERSIRNEICGT
jgi:hypothetical protein